MRWDPYVLVSDEEFDSFWHRHLTSRSRRVLFLIGKGFDPRALKALKRICDFSTNPKVCLLAFNNDLQESELSQSLTLKNHSELCQLINEQDISELRIEIQMNGRENSTSMNTRRALANQNGFSDVDDVVVDISAMPRTVALSAITQLIYDIDKAASVDAGTNLHVVVAESVSADTQANGSLNDEVASLDGFSGRLKEQTTEHVPRVWFPILGEHQHERLRRIQEHIDPDEICPLVPFPSRDPRRGDRIVSEHMELLFEEFRVEPSNILRVSEFNPFETYRQLHSAIDRYNQALSELGGCKAFVSPLSSKLLSVGALLACYDHRFANDSYMKPHVGIRHVETAIYADPPASDEESDLYSMWVVGEWEK